MTPTPGILYNIGDKIVCAEREMPLPGEFVKEPYRSYHTDEEIEENIKALKSWQESCKNVVNVRSSWGKMKLIIDNRFYDINDMFEFKSGQKCLKVPEGDKVRVTKLK